MTLVAGALLAGAVVVRRHAEARLLREAVPAGEVTATWRVAAAFLSARNERFPYAAAIGIGVAATLWRRGSLGALWTALGIA